MHLVAFGASPGFLLAGFAVVVLSTVTWHVPRGLKRSGFPRPRVAAALLFGATVAGLAQLVVIMVHAPFPFAAFPLPLWLFPYALVVPVAAVLLWTRGFRTSRNRWGAVILVLLLPVTSVGWGWISENARERHVQEQSGVSSDDVHSPGALDCPGREATELREPIGARWRDGGITQGPVVIVYADDSTGERLEVRSIGVASLEQGRAMGGADRPDSEDPGAAPCVADAGTVDRMMPDERTFVTLRLEPAGFERPTELTARIRPVTEKEYSVLVSGLD